jgi:hypothetical protein
MSPRDPMLVPVEITEDAAPDRDNDHPDPVDHVELVLTNGRSLRARATMSDAQWIRLIRIAEAA